MARKIDLRIGLEGGQDVARQFAELGKAGEEAFARVRAAANDNRNIRLVNLPQLKAQIAEVGKAGEEAFEKIGAASAKANQQVTQQTSFFSTLAGRITIVAGSLTALAAGYLAAAKGASESVVALGRQADAAGLSIKEFQQLTGTLTQLNLNEKEAVKVVETLGKTLAGAAEEAQKLITASGNIKFVPANAQIAKFNEELEATGSKLKIIDPAVVSTARSLEVFATIGTRASAGLSDTARQLLALGVVFDPLTGKVREGQEALHVFARVLKAMPDQAQAAKLATSAWGEDIAKILVPAIREGGNAFSVAFQSIERLNLGFDKAQRKVGQDMVNAFTRLKLATAQARTEFGLAFAPVFTPAINAFADALRRNRSAITEFVNQLVTTATPAINGFFKAITDFLDRPASFDGLRKGIEEAGTAISQIFQNVIVPAFTALKTTASQAAAFLSEAFGTKITGAMVAFGAAITLLIGPFNALAVAILAIFGGEGANFDAFKASLLELGIDIEAIKVQIIAAWEEIKTAFKDPALGAALKEFATSIPGIVTGLLTLLIFLQRWVGLNNVVKAGILNATGALDLFVKALIVVSASVFILLNTLKILEIAFGALLFVMTAIARHPVVFALGLMATAFLLMSGAGETARKVLKLFGIDLDAVNKSIDDYNKKSFTEAQAKSAAHYAAVKADIASAVAAYGTISEAIRKYNQTAFDDAETRMTAHFDAVKKDFEDFKEWLGGFDILGAIRSTWETFFNWIKARLAELRGQSSDLARQLGSEDIAGSSRQPRQRPGFEDIEPSTNVEDRRQQLLEGDQSAFDAAIAAAQQFAQQMQEIIAGIVAVAQQGAQAIATAFAEAMSQLVTNMQGVFAPLQSSFIESMGQLVGNIQGMLAPLQSGFSAAIQAIIAEFSTLATSIVGALSQGFSGIAEIIVAPFQAAATAIIAIWESVIAKIREAAMAAAQAQSSGGGGGFARGGYTGHGGTRQIAGFVHGGEYVQPARVVRQPGVLAFMDTLRRVGDLQKTIQLFTRGFSVGGLVDNFSARLSSLVIPKFASGGLVPALAPAGNSRLPDFGTVTLDFGRGQRVRGIADRQIVEALRRIAIQDQRLVAGRESS